LYVLIKGLEKEAAKFRAGQLPAETKAKIVQWTILPTRLAGGSLHPHKKKSKNFYFLLFFS